MRGEKLSIAWQSLQNICTQKADSCLQKQQLMLLNKQIKNTLKNANKATELLKYRKHALNTRVKRAWISIIGKAWKFLFGNLDEDDETEIKQIIEHNAGNTRQLSKLIANQTEVIYNEFGAMHDKATKLELLTDKIRLQEESNSEQIALMSAIELLEENILQYEIDTQVLTDTILFATQGVIHPRFISASQIENSAKLAAEVIKEATFPLAENRSISDIIKISDLAIFIVDQQLIFCLKIPLLDYT